MREVPAKKTVTVWRGNGRWFQRRDKAYYSIAKALVLAKYPRWLDDYSLSEEERGQLAAQCGIADWQARRDLCVELLYSANGAHFDIEKWKKFVWRVARFMMYVDDRRSELVKRTHGMLDPRDALDIEQRVSRICREWAASIGSNKHGETDVR